MVWLAGSLALIMWVVEERRVDFWHTWFVDLPIWVTPTFSLLALSRTYVTYWPRARLRDVLMVLFWLQTGILFSLGLALVIDPEQGSKWVLRAVLIAGISHPIIMASRLIYRCIEELVLWLKRQGDTAGETERVLLYGAGVRAQLFLKDRAMKVAKNPDGRNIIGFADDEKALHFQWVYGFLVLGGLKELPLLIDRKKVGRIIIVSELLPENLAVIQEITACKGVILSQWKPEEHEVVLPCNLSRHKQFLKTTIH
jgi:FlaA1/EpsC-like NDP-sugar epimerase